MSRFYQMFKTQADRKAWEAEQKKKDSNFRVCMRMTAKQLKEDLPFVEIGEYKFVTIWTTE